MNTSTIVQFFKKYDFTFLGLNCAIFLIGIINLYSATHANVESGFSNVFKMQFAYFIVSLFVSIVISFIQPKNFFRFAWFAYGFNVFLLILVLLLGQVGMGAQRWLVLGPIRIQPSEIMKVTVILALARWFSKVNPDKSLGIRNLVVPFMIAFVPALLVILEPDLGTGLLILMIFSILAFYRKLKWKSILILSVVGIICSGVMYNFGLKPYQKKRITTFWDSSSDKKGSGYNAIQSKIAIGSGRFFGKGFKKSSQASFNYLPEKHTDFVFSIFNEEHGFFGSIVLIGLYLVLIFRFIWLSSSVPRLFESILIMGLMSIYFLHTFINMGMVTGVLPIVGLPLPLMSYGGSSLMTFAVICGLATSVSNSRNLF